MSIDFSETELVGDLSDLRQGDIFIWNRQADDPWKKFGVIVTADCDLDKGKHGGVLSYVPILSAVDYIRLFVAPPMLAKCLAPKVDEVRACIHRFQRKFRPDFSELLSQEAIASWLDNSEVGNILDELSVPAGKDRNVARELLEIVKSARKIGSDSSLGELVDIISKIRVSKPADVLKQMSAKLCQLPGDALFLSGIEGFSEEGHVVYLRLVREAPLEAIAVRTSEVSRAEIGRRVARMKSPYVYCLTQMLAAVFSSIGLPDDYEVKRKLISDNLVVGS